MLDNQDNLVLGQNTGNEGPDSSSMMLITLLLQYLLGQQKGPEDPVSMNDPEVRTVDRAHPLT